MADCYPTTTQIVNPIDTRFEHVTLGVPDYNKFLTFTIVAGKRGQAPGELYWPRGVAIDEATHHILVANCYSNRVEIFSETGEYIYQLGVGELSRPWSIAIHGNSVYVCCWGNTISKFSLSDMRIVKKIGGMGSNNGQFRSPRKITTDPIGRVFIADTNNDRICVYDTNLDHLRNITYESMSGPYDVTISRDRIYVLCANSNPCLHVLTLEGDKLHSLITRGRGMGVLEPHFFCLDPLNNFVISDYENNSFRVFSPKGKLLHTIGREGHRPGIFNKPLGIAITPNRRLVSVLSDDNYGLLIFC